MTDQQRLYAALAFLGFIPAEAAYITLRLVRGETLVVALERAMPGEVFGIPYRERGGRRDFIEAFFQGYEPTVSWIGDDEYRRMRKTVLLVLQQQASSVPVESLDLQEDPLVQEVAELFALLPKEQQQQLLADLPALEKLTEQYL